MSLKFLREYLENTKSTKKYTEKIRNGLMKQEIRKRYIKQGAVILVTHTNRQNRIGEFIAQNFYGEGLHAIGYYSVTIDRIERVYERLIEKGLYKIKHFDTIKKVYILDDGTELLEEHVIEVPECDISTVAKLGRYLLGGGNYDFV